MLDRVGHVNLLTIDTSLFQGFVKEISRRAHKRSPRYIFAIARLFADQHQFRSFPFPEDGLGCMFPEIASPTTSGGSPQTLYVHPRRGYGK